MKTAVKRKLTSRQFKEFVQVASHAESCDGRLVEWDCGCSFACHCDAGRMNRVCTKCGDTFRVES